MCSYAAPGWCRLRPAAVLELDPQYRRRSGDPARCEWRGLTWPCKRQQHPSTQTSSRQQGRVAAVRGNRLTGHLPGVVEAPVVTQPGRPGDRFKDGVSRGACRFGGRGSRGDRTACRDCARIDGVRDGGACGGGTRTRRRRSLRAYGDSAARGPNAATAAACMPRCMCRSPGRSAPASRRPPEGG
jgi:hypothetical protein